MCNPAQTQLCTFVGSREKVFFLIQALQTCLDRWWKAGPCGPLPGLLLILHMSFVHHDSVHEHDILVKAFIARIVTPAHSLVPQSAIMLDD